MTDARRKLRALIEGQNAISVHVRRGDYVQNLKTLAFHGVCAPEWYASAMEAMASVVPDPCFFIFSNDPAWARDNLPTRWPCHFVDPQTDGRDYEDMHLMACCKHHIIANSTFSWWGAWLNPSPTKRVIAPKKWFADPTHDTRDITPETWTRL